MFDPRPNATTKINTVSAVNVPVLRTTTKPHSSSLLFFIMITAKNCATRRQAKRKIKTGTFRTNLAVQSLSQPLTQIP